MIPHQAGGRACFAHFGVDEATFRVAFEAALSRGADWAELFFEHRVDHQLGLEDGAVNRAHTTVRLGVGIRVIRGAQTGYAYTEDLTRAAIKAAAGTAALVAEGPAGRPPVAYTEGTTPNRYALDAPWSAVGSQRKQRILKRVEALAFAADPQIRKVRVGWTDSDQAILVVGSEGRLRFDRRPMARLRVDCTAERAGQWESNGLSVSARHGLAFFDEARLAFTAAEAVKHTLFLFDATPAPAGVMPVVLGAGSAGILLHEAIGHGMEADFCRKGTSIFSDALNQRVASPEITIVDDGTVPNTRGALNIDDEGTEAQRTVLVQNGILRSYMHDRLSAQHYGVAPTGNGRRQSFRQPPLPRMRHTCLLAGPHDPAAIIRSVKRGVYASTFSNGQVQIGAGDFSFYIKTGYLIEDGQLTRPIKDTNIIGNGPEVLCCIDMVGDDYAVDHSGGVCGKDGQGVPVSLGTPTARVSRITVGGVNPP